MNTSSKHSNSEEQVLPIEEAEERAQAAADQIVEKFQNSDPSARKRLFSQGLLLLLKTFRIIPNDRESSDTK